MAYTYVKQNHRHDVAYKKKPSIFDFALLIAILGGEKHTAKKLGLIRLAKGYEKFQIIKNTHLALNTINLDKDVGNR